MRRALVLLVTAFLTGCGGSHGTRTAASTAPTSPKANSGATGGSTDAHPMSDAALLRLLPASCRRQLIDPTIPASIRRKMRQHFLDDLRAAPNAPRGCGEITSELSPTGN